MPADQTPAPLDSSPSDRDPGTGERALSGGERAKESLVYALLLGDVGIVLLRLPFALATGSLTLLSEVVRSAFTMSASIFAFHVMRAMHRGRLSRFEFGIGKVEQFVHVLVGCGLVGSGLWVARNVVDTIFSPEEAATPLGLALAAIVNAVNLLKNALGWYAIMVAAREGASQLFRVQQKARFILMVSSLFLQVTLTMAAIARDGSIALLLDAVGAVFIAGLMLINGSSMIARALPDLLDAPVPPDLGVLIRSTAGEIIPKEEIARIRTRRSGRTNLAEVAVVGASWTSVPALHERGAAIAEALRNAGREVEVTVVLAPERDLAGPVEQALSDLRTGSRQWTCAHAFAKIAASSRERRRSKPSTGSGSITSRY